MKEIDSYLSFALNIIGVIAVVYSIDSNLGLFKKGGLFTIFKNYIRAFPLLKREPIAIVAEPGKYELKGFPPDIKLTKTPESIEELFEYTRTEIKELRQVVKEERRDREAAISKVNKEWAAKHASVSKSVSEINEQLEAVAIGAINLQIFGVLLVAYGSYIGISA